MSDELKEQTRGEQLRKALLYDKKNGYDRLVPGELEAMEAYCTGYKQFLDAGKTERECVDRTIALAEQAGFRPYVRGAELKPGDKVYRINRGKAITLAFTVFFAVNIAVTCVSVYRWTDRVAGNPADSGFWEFVDERFPNERMEKIFANMVFVEDP